MPNRKAIAAAFLLAGTTLVNAQQKNQADVQAVVNILPVQGNIYMLVGAGANITASVGRDGVLLVDSGTAAMTGKVLSTVLQLATALPASPAPIHCVGMHCPGTPYGWSSPSINAIISSPAP